MARKTIALLALENELPVENEVVTPAEVTEARDNAVVDTVAEAPESDLLEMQEIATEMDEIESVQEEGEETAGALTEIQDKLEESVPEGGIDPIAAEAIRIAVEHMTARLGMPKGKSGIAIEGFKSKTTRIQATNIAIESIGDTVKKIWEALLATIKKVIESVKAFFGKLFDAAKKQSARADAILAAAEGKKDKKAPADAKVKIDGLLRKGNKLLEGQALVQDLADNEKIIAQSLEFLNGEHVPEAASRVKAALAALATGKAEEATKLTEDVKGSFAHVLGGLKKEGENNFVSDELIGDRRIVAVADEKTTKVTIGFEDVKSKSEIKDTEVAPLTPAEAGNVAKEVKVQMENILKFEAQLKKLEEAQVGLMEGLVAAVKGSATLGKEGKSGAEGGELGATTAELRQAVNSVIGLSGTFVTKAKGYQASVAGAALNLAAASLKVAA